MFQSKTKIHCVIMDNHFLYLPLFYARNQGFFGFVPNNYDFEIITSKDHTDISAFQMLMNKKEHVEFAVADPTCAFWDEDSLSVTKPVIMAALITNAAFWAVDRQSRKVTLFSDLGSFDTIIAFKPGTTSYGIAQGICNRASKQVNIYQVDPLQELVALRKSDTGTVAFSPDIIGIEHLLHHYNSFSIEYFLGNAPELNSI